MSKSNHQLIGIRLKQSALLFPLATLAFLSTTGANAATLSPNYQQIFSFSVGPYQPASAAISKGSTTFTYDKTSTSTFFLEAGAATRIFSLGGTVYANANLAYLRFNGNSDNSQSDSQGLSVNLFGLDLRLIHAWEWFPIKWIIPFIEFGYLYTVFTQFGSSDVNSVQGDTGNKLAATGIRFWVNPSASVRSEDTLSYFSLPIFLTLKWNRIFPNGHLMDLGSSGVIFSASVGL